MHREKVYKVFLMAIISLILGSLLYRYYSFATLYQEYLQIEEERKKISLEYREILSWYKKKKLTSAADRPKILIKIETD